MDIPILAFIYQLPPDGLPLLHSWLQTARDIWFRGYESWRELFETKASAAAEPGAPYTLGSVTCVKGMGRLSIIIYGLVYTYVKMRDGMSPEAQLDFTRPWVR